MALGIVYNQRGMLLNNELLQLVHLDLSAGEQVQPHDHKGQEVFFTLVRGEVELSLDEKEEHRLSAGEILYFPGEVRVGVRAIVDSEFVVYLINRK